MKIEANKSVVVEDVDNLVMTCTVDGSPGNPATYTYHWTSPIGDSSETSSTQLTVSMADLDATLHDGTWQCQAENAGGKSLADNLGITVNGNIHTPQINLLQDQVALYLGSTWVFLYICSIMCNNFK